MIKVSGTGTVAKDSIKTHRTESGKDKLEFRLFDGKLHHTIIAWEEVAKPIPAEGDYVFIDGRLGYRSYENKEGNKVWVTEVTVNTIEVLSGMTAAKDTAPEGDLGF